MSAWRLRRGADWITALVPLGVVRYGMETPGPELGPADRGQVFTVAYTITRDRADARAAARNYEALAEWVTAAENADARRVRLAALGQQHRNALAACPETALPLDDPQAFIRDAAFVAGRIADGVIL